MFRAMMTSVAGASSDSDSGFGYEGRAAAASPVPLAADAPGRSIFGAAELRLTMAAARRRP